MKNSDLAKKLRGAYNDKAVPALRLECDDLSQARAYEIQELNTKAWLKEGKRLIGRKIGLTSEAVQKQLGVDKPDYGMLFADSTYSSGETLSLSHFLQPKIEAEIAFVLKEDLTGEQLTIVDVMNAIDYAVPAIEIVDSRIENWDISLFDTIADNASYGGFIVGTKSVALSELDLEGCKMLLTADGEEISSGIGSACLGNPLLAVLWLAQVMIDVKRPLKAGDTVLSGALGSMCIAEKNKGYRAEIEGLGSVCLSFTE